MPGLGASSVREDSSPAEYNELPKDQNSSGQLTPEDLFAECRQLPEAKMRQLALQLLGVTGPAEERYKKLLTYFEPVEEEVRRVTKLALLEAGFDVDVNHSVVTMARDGGFFLIPPALIGPDNQPVENSSYMQWAADRVWSKQREIPHETGSTPLDDANGYVKVWEGDLLALKQVIQAVEPLVVGLQLDGPTVKTPSKELRDLVFNLSKGVKCEEGVYVPLFRTNFSGEVSGINVHEAETFSWFGHTPYRNCPPILGFKLIAGGKEERQDLQVD